MENAELWKKLMEPFDDNELELLSKYTGFAKDSNGKIPKSEYKKCDECGGYHPFPCIHLTYVGHAGITDRLNSIGPENWSWEPMAYDSIGQPLIAGGGMWIWLTVLGKRLPAFGDAQGKSGPNAIKEIIGDALRNGAMRFGIGTYLWSKSDKAKAALHRQGIDPDADEKYSEATMAQFRKVFGDYVKDYKSEGVTGEGVKKWLEDELHFKIETATNENLTDAMDLIATAEAKFTVLMDKDIDF